MPLNARRMIRKMRGGAQAHLLECDDDNFYVVKFINNPQGRRILINEWIGAALLRQLGLTTPPTAIVRTSDEFLEANPEAFLERGTSTERPHSSWHFGSQYPANPYRTLVWDLLPDGAAEETANASDLLGVLAFDKWTSNADGRQSIFYRARVQDGLNVRPAFVTSMIDNGFLFQGPEWTFRDAPAQGLYYSLRVYRGVRGLEHFEPWLSRIESFPASAIDAAIKAMPSVWFQDNAERDELDRMMERLLLRRSRVRDLIVQVRELAQNPFPNWRG